MLSGLFGKGRDSRALDFSTDVAASDTSGHLIHHPPAVQSRAVDAGAADPLLDLERLIEEIAAAADSDISAYHAAADRARLPHLYATSMGQVLHSLERRRAKLDLAIERAQRQRDDTDTVIDALSMAMSRLQPPTAIESEDAGGAGKARGEANV